MAPSRDTEGRVGSLFSICPRPTAPPAFDLALPEPWASLREQASFASWCELVKGTASQQPLSCPGPQGGPSILFHPHLQAAEAEAEQAKEDVIPRGFQGEGGKR